jgi:hypothetical protein
MTLFHGTPHKFDAFDMSKIGTGEGVQAYGHGLYFAENPGVASSYKQALSRRSGQTSLSDVMKSFEVGGKQMLAEYPVEVDAELARLIDEQDWVVAKRYANERARRWRELEADESYQFRDYASEKADAWERLSPVLADGKVDNPSLGHLYEVDIPDETIDKMLDWDAPLSEQPEALAGIRQMFKNNPDIGAYWQSGPQVSPKNMTGQEFYRAIAGAPNRSRTAFSADEAASRALNEAGIPGIRYFDGGSRGAGEGTRNIVVFDESVINKVKRDGETVYNNMLKGKK